MLVKRIKYTDYDGNEREEDFMFNLNQAEITSLMLTEGEYTLDKVVEKLYKERNGKKIMKTFADIIYAAYGEKSLDGRMFDKSEEVKKKFMQTEAYSVLFMELISDAHKAAEFINGIIPSDIANAISKIVEENIDGIPNELREYLITANK